MTGPPSENVEDRIRVLLEGVIQRDVPSSDVDLIEEGLLDSLSLVELLFEIEQEFDVAVSLESLDLDDIRSVRGIGRLLSMRDWPDRRPPS